MDVKTKELKRITTSNDISPCWSPDCHNIVFIRNDDFGIASPAYSPQMASMHVGDGPVTARIGGWA